MALKKSATVNIQLVITNAKARRALRRIEDYFEEAVETRDWDADAAKMLRAVRYAIANLDIDLVGVE